MKCLSCDLEIMSTWKHAIEQNVCPFCGQAIMDPACTKLLSSLNSITSSLKESFPNHLEDWLEHNCDFVPKSKLTELENKMKSMGRVTRDTEQKQLESDSIVTSVQDQAVTDKFLKNSGANRYLEETKSKDLKSLVSQIKSNGVAPGVVMSDDSEDYQQEEPYDDGEEIPASVFALAQQSSSSGDPSKYNAKDLASLKNMVEKSQGGRGKVSFRSK